MGLNNFDKNSDPIERKSFADDLRMGKRIEHLCLNIIRHKHPDAYVAEGKVKEYDIFIPKTGEKIEVKADMICNKTGKFVIEVVMNGKTSGLITTKSDYWMLYTGDRLITIKPDTIKNIILANGIPRSEFYGRGDANPKYAYFVPLRMLLDECDDFINL